MAKKDGVDFERSKVRPNTFIVTIHDERRQVFVKTFAGILEIHPSGANAITIGVKPR